MKTILVPTDFSDYALIALKVAASIARKIKAEILLVHRKRRNKGFKCRIIRNL